MLNQNRFKNEGARVMTKFSINSHGDLYLDPITLKREMVQSNVTPNTSVKLYQNWLINKVARAMTKGGHTYVRT